MKSSSSDVEKCGPNDEQTEPLLSGHGSTITSTTVVAPRRAYSFLQLLSSFGTGFIACLLVQYLLFNLSASDFPSNTPVTYGSPHAGSTKVHQWPPPKPTNTDPGRFPVDVGHGGPTPTGAEPALIATAPVYPSQTHAPNLVAPTRLHGQHHPSKHFDLLKKWGNLTPWYSVPKGTFGINAGPEVPETCRITGLHYLHRHGARYPTTWASYGGPDQLASRLHNTTASWTAKGELEFLNDWTYKLGEEVLTPFGRQQLFDLGVSLRLKYGFLLENYTDALPVFRTESQDRMLYSALNFAGGFFGIPYEDKYLQSITIEGEGFNNTLAPYKTCKNFKDSTKSDRGTPLMKEWIERYLHHAQHRLQKQISGYNLSIEDTYIMQQMCAYETVAIGFSKFCALFSEEEWEGFDYALDIYFWYNSGFGSPLAAALGIGYVQELVARLTHTPIAVHNSSTNSTLDNDPMTFPLDHTLYVDATHEVVVLNVITALNLTSFAKAGPLPTDHIPKHLKYKVSQIAPFATNVQFQLLSCEDREDEQIRVIINDAVAPLSGIEGCGEDKKGMCALPAFVAGQKKIIEHTDWDYVCEGQWDVPPGHEWTTTTGSPPGAEW